MSMLFKMIKDWATTITAFRTGDVIPVDGPSGTAKMGKDDLLRVTAENSLSGNVATAFDATKDYVANNVVSYGGKVYRFKVNHPAGAWDASHVDNFDLGSHFFSAMPHINDTSVYSSFNDLPNNTSFLILVDLSNSPLPADIPWGICYTIGLQGSSYCVQIMTSILSNASKNNITWTRVKRAGTWGNWKQLLSDADLSKVFSIGGNIPDASVYQSLDDIPVNHAFLISTSSIPKPTGASSPGGVVYSFGSSASNQVQLYTDIGSASTRGFTWIRAAQGGTWSAWQKVLTSQDVDTSLNASLLMIENVTELDISSAVTGTYVNLNGTTGSSPNSWYLDNAISVPAHTTLSIIARSYLTNVGIISKKLGANSYQVLVTGRSSDAEVYEWTNDSDSAVSVTISSLGLTGLKYFYKLSEVVNDKLKVSLTCFESIGCLGDSYTAGQIYKNGSESVGTFNGKFSWPTNLARETNVDITNYGVSGASTHSAKTNVDQLPKILSDDPKDLYLLTLGINDYNRVDADTYLGTPADMDTEDYTQSADTYYGNYYYIIEAIKEHAPNAVIIMITPARMSPDDVSNYYTASLNIAQTAGIPCLPSFGLKEYSVYENRIGGHPTIAGYSLMSRFYRQIIENYLNSNPSILNKMAWL